MIACPCAVCHSSDVRDSRLRTSVLIEVDGKTIVIDTGPDFRQQMLRADVKNLDAVFFTHAHKDHTAGLDDVRAYNHVQQKPMDVYAEELVQDAIKQEFSYVFAKNKYPGIPEITLHIIDEKPFNMQGIPVVPIRAMHLHLPILGFRIYDFTYITDANYISDDEKEKIKGSKCFVINGLRKQNHISHFSLDEAIQLLEEIKPQKGIITHISHQMGFHSEVEAMLPRNVQLAYDGLVVEV